jgi:hypothetical protein
MSRDPFDSIFFGNEFSKVMDVAVWPGYPYAANRAFCLFFWCRFLSRTLGPPFS